MSDTCAEYADKKKKTTPTLSCVSSCLTHCNCLVCGCARQHAETAERKVNSRVFSLEFTHAAQTAESGDYLLTNRVLFSERWYS